MQEMRRTEKSRRQTERVDNVVPPMVLYLQRERGRRNAIIRYISLPCLQFHMSVIEVDYSNSSLVWMIPCTCIAFLSCKF